MTFDGPTSDSPGPSHRMLALESGYTLEAIRERELLASVTCRDLGGFFGHVWSVHPFATLVTSDSWGRRSGPPATYPVAERHTIIEGCVGRFAALERIPALNFLISQIDLFLRLARLVRRERVSVIRAGDPLYLGLFGWALARWTGVPLVVRVGGNHDKVYETTGRPLMPRFFRSRRAEKVVERFVFRRADLVAGANRDNLDFALANGARPERSTLFRYGNLIDHRHFVAPEHREEGVSLLHGLGVRPGRFLLYIGRLESVKHPDDVVRVLAEVRRRGHDVAAVLAGDGRLGPELRRLAVDLGVADHVVLCGNRSQEWLARVIPHAAVVVSPHTGRALSEVALAGAAVAGYDVDWQAELIEPGVTGELVEHCDRTALSDAVDRLLRDDERRRKLGGALREAALQMLDREALDQHERDEYTRLLGPAAVRTDRSTAAGSENLAVASRR